MSRIAEAIIGKDRAYAAGRNAPMVDLRYGGQQGHAPQHDQWINNQGYVSRQLIALLVEAPLGFNYLPNPEYWVGTLRSLVEVHALQIEGLVQNLEVAVEETSIVGGGGEVHEDFTNVTQARSTPTFTWNEKYGMPIWRFFRGWITNLIMDPNSKVANVATFANVPGDMLADMYTMSVAFIEPDPTHKFVVKSWLSTNMFPKGIDGIESRKDRSAPGTNPRYNIGFTSLTATGDGIDLYCQGLLNNINITGANPNMRQAFITDMTDIDGNGLNVNVAAQNYGYDDGVTRVANGNMQQG